MYKTIINNLIKVKNEFSELRSNLIWLNKYQNLCFNEIESDLNNMMSFVKSLEFIEDNENKFERNNGND